MFSLACLWVMTQLGKPLSMIAWVKQPFTPGQTSILVTEAPPADSPAMVMRSGSPPKASTLSRIQLSARIWSLRPQLESKSSQPGYVVKS